MTRARAWWLWLVDENSIVTYVSRKSRLFLPSSCTHSSITLPPLGLGCLKIIIIIIIIIIVVVVVVVVIYLLIGCVITVSNRTLPYGHSTKTNKLKCKVKTSYKFRVFNFTCRILYHFISNKVFHWHCLLSPQNAKTPKVLWKPTRQYSWANYHCNTRFWKNSLKWSSCRKWAEKTVDKTCHKE